MCCVRARPAAFAAAAAAAGVGWGERQRARGGGAAGPPGLVRRPASQGQESLEIFETEMLAFCGIDGPGHQPACPSPLPLGSRAGSQGWW